MQRRCLIVDVEEKGLKKDKAHSGVRRDGTLRSAPVEDVKVSKQAAKQHVPSVPTVENAEIVEESEKEPVALKNGLKELLKPTQKSTQKSTQKGAQKAKTPKAD